MARLAEPLMGRGSSPTTLSFFDAERVVDHYNVMGPVKAALEASARYLAHELGVPGVRVNAISEGRSVRHPGPTTSARARRHR
jgi:enoyl-[acyl-carrier protein] reductase I